MLALSACAPTEGISTAFKPEPTTNFDFTITSIAVGNNPLDIAVADYDGATGPDIAVANHVDGTVTVLTNTGSGAFTAQTVAVGGQPFRLLWFNLAGGAPSPATPLALAVLTQVQQPGPTYTHHLVILTSSGGTFAVSKSYDFGAFVAQIEAFCVGENPCLAATPQDLVATVPVNKSVAVFTNANLNTATLAPVLTTTSYTPPGGTLANYNPTRFAVGAIDAATGATDLAVLLLLGANVVLPLIGDGSGGFTAGTAVPVPAIPYAVAGGVLGGVVGTTDFVVTSVASSIVSILLNDGAGGMTRTDYGATAAGEILVGIVAGSGSDILVANRSQEQVTYLNGEGTGAFTASALGSTIDPFAFAMGNYGGDASKDFVSSESVKRVLGVYHGDGAGNFGRTQIGFESLITHPTTVNGLCGGANDDLVALQPNVDTVLVLCRK
jgi:hypothetical protein